MKKSGRKLHTKIAGTGVKVEGEGVRKKERSSQQSDSGSLTTFTGQDVQQQIQRILDSPDFDATRQQRAFLDFVVSETLAGNGHDIKGYTVATRVFGRDENFDQAIDPIVSIQANKLRRSLERYYLLAGKDDGIRIDIPRGSYVPVFSEQKPYVTRHHEFRRSLDQDRCSAVSWPTVIIKPFQNLTNDPEKNCWGAGFAAELTTEINRFKWISVLQYGPEAEGRRSSDTGARFIVDGSIRADNSGFKLVVNLLDAKENKQIWSDTQRFDNGISQIISFQEKIASLVGVRVAGEQGVITRTLVVESRDKHPSQLKTYEAILRYHAYDQTLEPEDFARAFQALENARVAEPECGQIWSFLARLYANIYSLEVPGFDVVDSERKALEYAEKGAQLNPDNQGALGVLALARMFSNEIEAARLDINMAYEMNPNSLYLMDGIGYIKTLLGDWEQGPQLIRKAIEFNPYYKTVVHYALWTDYIRQHDFENAYLETAQLRRPAVFWYPLAKASSLGLLGRIDEGKKCAKDLIKLKPDFRERGRVLIGRYIKFDDIADLVIDGLNKVGVKVD